MEVDVQPDVAWMWWLAAVAMHLWSFGLVFFDCLRHRREATSSLLWIFVSWSFPLIGPFFYLFFGVDRAPDRGFRKYAKDQRLQEERRVREDEELQLACWRGVRMAVRAEPTDDFGRRVNRLLDGLLADHLLLGGNELTPLAGGDEAYPVMEAAIQGARHHVHLASFIVGDDAVGRRFMDLLVEKARAGVDVRLLYDRFGCTSAILSGFLGRYRRKGVRMAGWTQVNPLRRRFQINLRNHRKILVVDGAVAFCGGLNLHGEHLSDAAGPGIRDYHFKVRGPTVHELQYTFMRDWYYMTDEDPDRLLTSEHFPHIDPVGTSLVRVVNSGPSAAMETLGEVFFGAIVEARRQVLAVTPYFVPPRELVTALRTAARRGVDVRLLVPERNNHFYVGLAGRALYEELLDSGVRIFERPPPFIHAKALIVDDVFSLVGTANMDVRSLKLNYETDLAVFDSGFADRLKRLVWEDLSVSREVDPVAWRARPTAQRLAENLCYLSMPIL